MRIEPNVYLVGSGQFGFDMTDPFDCNIFLFDAGGTYVLFDAGAGMGMDQILDTCQQDGLDPGKLDHLFLTHAHADHAGGAALLRDRTSATTYASAKTAKIVETGDEEAVSLAGARQAGIYPGDYVYRSCPVNHVLEEGDSVELGSFKIELISTPGHSHDHCSYLVADADKRYLVGGDAIFYGGRVVLQNTYDCSVPETIASILHLSTYEFEALLPGHLVFSLNNGMRHIEAARAVIERFGCPESIA